MLITNGPPENRPINGFLLPPVSPTMQGNEQEEEEGVNWSGVGGGEEVYRGEKASIINCFKRFY